MTSIHVERNSEKPDLEVLSVPQRDDNTGITGGQLSLDIGDLVSSCTTEVNLSLKVQALSKSDKFAYMYLRRHSRPDPHFIFPKTFTGGCKRSLSHVWLDQHKWLHVLAIQ